MQIRKATAEEMLERGVYVAPYLFQGVAVLIAVDRNGDVRKHLKLTPGVDEVRAVRWLEQLLDRIDPPRPQLQLVKSTPAVAHRAIVPNDRAPTDPRDETHLAFALRMARRSAHRFRRYE